VVIIRSVAIIAIATIIIGGSYIGTPASSNIGVSVVDSDIATSVNIPVAIPNSVVIASVVSGDVSCCTAPVGASVRCAVR
jgi:hypothetical protein